MSECMQYIEESGGNAIFQVLLCEESSNNCINETCLGECNEMHFNRTDCGSSCTMDIQLRLPGRNVQPSPCFQLSPEVYENNSQMYSGIFQPHYYTIIILSWTSLRYKGCVIQLHLVSFWYPED